MINPTVDGIVATGLMVPTIAAMYLAAHISLETWIYRQHMFGRERIVRGAFALAMVTICVSGAVAAIKIAPDDPGSGAPRPTGLENKRAVSAAP